MSTLLTRTEKQALRTLIPLSTLPDKHYEELCSTCRVHNGTPGTLLFQQGDKNPSFYYLLSGKVSFSIGDIQVETIESDSQPAKFALAHQLPRKVTATALTTIRFIRLESRELGLDDLEYHPADCHPTKAAPETSSITSLLLSDQDQSSERSEELQIREIEPSAGNRFFKRLKTRIFHRNSAKVAPPESSLSEYKAVENFSTQSKVPQATEYRQTALPLKNTLPFLQSGNHGAIKEIGWKQSLPEEIEKKLKAVLLPLMQEISDIGGSLVATEQGSFLSPEFPKHRIQRIQAIVHAVKIDVHDDRDFPEEILVRERNLQILIFLIGAKGLLALNANSAANLGLIRLEAYPVVTRIREIISLESKYPYPPAMP